MNNQNKAVETLKVSLHCEKQATLYFSGLTVVSITIYRLLRSYGSVINRLNQISCVILGLTAAHLMI